MNMGVMYPEQNNRTALPGERLSYSISGGNSWEERIVAMIALHVRFPLRFGHILFLARPIEPSPHSESENDAIAATTEQFEAFFRQHERQITGYLCRMVGDEQIAHDLCQETFVRAWQHFAQLRESAYAKAWLYRVSTNLALRYCEQRQAHPICSIDDMLPGDSDPGRGIAERDRVQHVLMQLTVKQRSALILHEVHGFSCDEIGNLLHLSRDAVKMALWRAREQFRTAYLHEEELM
jgi:RNA polymerase sigma-70 factor, ECF subfamily